MLEQTRHGHVVPSGAFAGRRKICYICTWNNLGGTETLILRHIRWLSDHGLCAVVISPHGTMSEDYRRWAAAFIELTEAQADHAGMTDRELGKRNDWIADKLGRETPCHFIAFSEAGIHMAAELCARIEGSALSTYLVFDDIFGPDKLPYLEEMNESGMVISMNEGCLEGHRKRFGYRLESRLLVPLPMRFPAVMRKRQGPNGCIILTVARLVEMKGYVEGLIRDFAELSVGQGPSIRLIVIGDGPCRVRFEKAAARCGISSRVDFVGSVPYSALNEYYYQADIFVGMGTTVLEAASLGVPAIVAIAHTREFITSGLFGADAALDLGEPHCRAPLLPGRRLLRELITSADARESAGAAGRSKVLAQFEQEVVMRKFLRVLEQNAHRLKDIPRPRPRVPFAALRRYVKRFFGYHPWIMRTGRTISLLARHLHAKD